MVRIGAAPRLTSHLSRSPHFLLPHAARLASVRLSQILQSPSMSKSFPKLHNAMWPGLVGKGDGPGQEPAISLERMLDLTAAASVNGKKFDGIDYFLFLPHTNPEATDDEIKKIADSIAKRGFAVGSLVAPVWPGT